MSMKAVLHADFVKCSKKGHEEIQGSQEPLQTILGGRVLTIDLDG